jgi:hypothetical protein
VATWMVIRHRRLRHHRRGAVIVYDEAERVSLVALSRLTRNCMVC